MSSAKSRRQQRSKSSLFSRRAAVACLMCIAAGPMLAGCGPSGFHPLYGSAGLGGADAQAKFAAVDFAPIPGRVGQRIRNELIFESSGGGGENTVPPEYRLEVAVNEYVSSTLVRIDGNANGQVSNIDAAFKLIRIKDKAVVLTGTSYGRAGFERVTSIFSNVRAREEAENRCAKTVGEEMRTRLLAYLSRPA